MHTFTYEAAVEIFSFDPWRADARERWIWIFSLRMDDMCFRFFPWRNQFFFSM